MERFLLTGGGKIQCLRCTAHNRKGAQCGRPALVSSRTQKCEFHGGASVGPRTEEGKERIRQAHWKHGERSAKGVEEAAKANAQIRQSEDALRILGAISGPRGAGRPPSRYMPLKTMADVRAFASTLAEPTEGDII